MTIEQDTAPIITLHSYRRCPFAIRVRVTLEEKGIAYRCIEESLSNPSPELLRLHPQGLVPLLIHDKTALYESAVITEYLDEVFPQPKLMPSEPKEKALVRLWTHWSGQIFKPDLDAYKYEFTKLPAPEQEQLFDRLSEHLRKLDAALAAGPYLMGAKFTLADVHVFPLYRQLTRVVPALALLSEHPNVNRWITEMTARPSFLRAMEKR